MPSVSSLMTPAQFKAGLRILNMSYSGFARYTGKTTQTVYAYAAGRRPIPKLVCDTLAGLVETGQVGAEFHRKKRSPAQMEGAARGLGHGKL